MIKEIFKKHRDIIPVVSLAILSILVLLPFFKDGFFPTHDGEWTVVRLADMFRTLRDGQFPARYSGYLNNQYGYPLFNFAYPLPYYIGMVPVFLKFGFLNSIKLLFVLSTVVSIIGMYFLSSRVWKSTSAGFVSAILFLFLPYRMVDLYVRGSLGEVMALAIIPLLFLTGYSAVQKKSLIFSTLSGILLGLLIPTHNIMSLLFVPIFFVFTSVIALKTDKKSILYVLLSLILGVGISAFFWLPAIAEKSLILLSVVPIADRGLYFVSLNQLLLPSWGFGVPTDSQDSFTYHIGVAHVIGFLLSIYFLVYAFMHAKKRNIKTYIALTSIGMAVISLLLMFEFSSFVWEHVPLLSEINYPWTLIAPVGFLISLVIGFAASQNYRMRNFTLILAFLSVGMVLQYAHPSEYLDRDDNFYVTNAATTTSSQEYTPLWVSDLPVKSPEQKIEVASGEAGIEVAKIQSNKIEVLINAQTDTVIRMNTIYYPGWEVTVDGSVAEFSYDNSQGVMDVLVPSGNHTVTAQFSETPLRAVANGVTLVSIIASVLIIVSQVVRKKYAKT